jgi:probable biosynthetic protein (TIGR04098 family)
MASDWNDYALLVQMPHMAPGEKLSEVEFLKLLAAHQWESIARALGRRPSEIASAQKERLYGSVIDVEVHLARGHSLDFLGEDVHVHVRNRVRFFAKKFVEGLFLIDDRPIPDAELAAIGSRKDLASLGRSYACMTNAFIARTGGNVRLKVFKPEGADAAGVQDLADTPYGIVDQARVQSTGFIEPLGDEGEARPLPVRRDELIPYRIVPESDLNGAGLVYFARYEAMMNYAERVFLTEHLDVPVSTDLVASLSTDHRKAFFFANASPADTVLAHVSASVLDADPERARAAGARYRVPLALLFRIDLYRSSDRMLMASSLVRKSLNVAGNAKAVLAEVQRLLRRLA